MPPAAATPYPTPEGWQQLEVLKVTANYANQPAQVPIGAVLKPAASNTDTKQLVVVLRGAAFKGDSAYSECTAVLLCGCSWQHCCRQQHRQHQ